METKKTRKENIIAGAVIVLIAAIMVGIILGTAKPSKPTDYEYVTVQNGDTLWKLAEMSDGFDHMDRRDIIADMITESDTLNRGDIVGIPMYGEETAR